MTKVGNKINPLALLHVVTQQPSKCEKGLSGWLSSISKGLKKTKILQKNENCLRGEYEAHRPLYRRLP